MNGVLLQMVVVIGCGVVWGWLRPGGYDNRQARAILSTAVYNLFLPALVLRVIWQAPLGLATLQIACVAASGVLVSLALAWAGMRLLRLPAAIGGACLLAAAWPNATYLGLPLLVAVFGEFGRSTAIQYDLFACTPLLLTVGILIARHYGAYSREDAREELLPALLRVPPLWTAIIAVVLNMAALPMPAFIEGTLQMLGNAVVPLMLFSLGLSLRWRSLHWRQLPALVPVIVIQLGLMPLTVWAVATLIGIEPPLLHAVVLEAALPSMVLGLVICDRYELDTGVYAAAVTLTTGLSLMTLPFWYRLFA
jgi:predicted permease